MKINAGIIGMGIGQKHFDAIEGCKNSIVKIICEKDPKKIKKLKKKYPNKLITSDENKIFSDKSVNLVSIASYDNFHFKQIVKSIHTNNVVKSEIVHGVPNGTSSKSIHFDFCKFRQV